MSTPYKTRVIHERQLTVVYQRTILFVQPHRKRLEGISPTSVHHTLGAARPRSRSEKSYARPPHQRRVAASRRRGFRHRGLLQRSNRSVGLGLSSRRFFLFNSVVWLSRLLRGF